MNDSKLINRLINKSEEAFIMSLEIYNKPTIEYRVEGFAFFICNAWELLLKAQMIDKYGNRSIYYKDNPERTLSLEKCIEKVFTNKKDPLRLNLEKIIELRNTSTHFITDEYELVYMPLFQACVLNYSDKALEFFRVDVNKKVSQNFLTLSANYSQIDDTQIRAKYSPEVARHLLAMKSEVNDVLDNEASPSFAITINHQYFITKKKSEAEATVAVDNTADNSVKILKVVQDPNNVYKYTAKKSVTLINQALHKNGNANYPINMWVFTRLISHYSMKDNDEYTFTFQTGSNVMYKYSYKAIQFLVGAIESQSDLIKNLHKK